MLNYFKSRYFRMSYFIYFFVLGVLIFVFCSVFLYRVQRERLDEEEKEIKAQTELMVQILDEKFNMIDQMALQISQSAWKPYVSSKSNILYSRVDYFKQKEICQQIDTLNILLQISNSAAVVFSHKELAVDGDGFWEMEHYLKRIGFGEEYRNILVEKINCNSIAMELIAGEDSDSGDFVVLKQLTTGQSFNDLFFVLVDGRYFKKFLSTNIAEAVCFELYYGGEAIYSSVQNESEEGLTEIRMSSSVHPWEYVFYIQKEDNANLFTETQYIMIGCLGIAMAVMILSYFLACLTYHPIVRMVRRHGSKNGEEFYGLEQLEQLLHNQQVDKEQMEELGNRYYHMGLNNFLNSLLSGTYEKEKVEEYAKGFHTDFKEKMVYLVIVFVMDEDERKSSFLDIMLKFQMMSLYNKITAVICNIEAGYTLILGTEECKEILIQQQEKLNMYLDEYLPDHDVALYMGEVHSGFRGIYYSYLEAQESFRRRTFAGGELYYYYPFDEEMRMINHLRNGNFQEVRNILCKLEKENRMRELLPETERKLIDVIQENFNRFTVEISMDVHLSSEVYLETYEQRDIPGLWECLREQVSKIEEGYQKNRLYPTLGRSLVEYVNENFTCSELSQQSIADYFGVARPTVSKTFKETTNMNFVDYLHKQRVAHAKMLVQAGNYDVLDVGRKSGYENEVTFKRAFVKHEGITPREYVKCCRKIM